ncbi:putative CHY-type Zn-finger protein [Pullulanibacillus pueri]|nr:putative CHY-type Zn-finger protein [Pullulanibacillus pueri]
MNDRCKAIIDAGKHNIDGLNCPICDGPIFPKPFNETVNHIEYKRGKSRYEYLREYVYQRFGSYYDFLPPDEFRSFVDNLLFNPPKLSRVRYGCLSCGHTENVQATKQDYSEVRVCPKCNGAFVDVWKINKYKSHNNNNNNNKPKQPLLKITLEDINAVPKVFYNGEEITDLVHVGIDWNTNTESFSPTHIKIKHADYDKPPNTKVIEHNPPEEIINVYDNKGNAVYRFLK